MSGTAALPVAHPRFEVAGEIEARRSIAPRLATG